MYSRKEIRLFALLALGLGNLLLMGCGVSSLPAPPSISRRSSKDGVSTPFFFCHLLILNTPLQTPRVPRTDRRI